MKKKILFLVVISITVLGSCKKEENEPIPPIIPQQSYTTQELTSSVASNLFWVIDGDTLALVNCSPVYYAGDYHASFNFAVGVEYDFKILRGIPPSLTSFELKNEGTIKFIDGNSSTNAYGGVSSVVINQGASWTYNIFYGQCGSIDNQLQVIP